MNFTDSLDDFTRRRKKVWELISSPSPEVKRRKEGGKTFRQWEREGSIQIFHFRKSRVAVVTADFALFFLLEMKQKGRRETLIAFAESGLLPPPSLPIYFLYDSYARNCQGEEMKTRGGKIKQFPINPPSQEELFFLEKVLLPLLETELNGVKSVFVGYKSQNVSEWMWI